MGAFHRIAESFRFWRTIGVYARALVRRRATEADLDEEVRYHLERDVERRLARGETLADAQAAARRDFGNITLLTEQARDASRVHLIEQTRQDTRYAIRGFIHSPRFALTVVLTIGLGLGLVTTAFTIFDAYVLRVFAVRDPRSLFELRLLDRWKRERSATWNEYQELRRSNPAFSEAYAARWVVARRNGEPVMVQAVSGNCFRMLDISPALGRLLEPDDASEQGSAPVVVLSHRVWQTKFGADSAIVGKLLHLNDKTFEVVGVAREGFEGLSDTPPDVWLPITMASTLDDFVDASGPDAPTIKVIGRLSPGMTISAATRTLSTWAVDHTADRPERNRATGVFLESRAAPVHMSPATMVQVSPIFVAFALVLMIACANVANMMLARGMARQREFGIRLALGAARPRLIRQLMTEALLLTIPAGAVGFVVSRGALGAGVRLMFATVPAAFVPYLRVLPLEPDVRLFAFLLVCAVAAALAFGLAPALQTTRTDVVSATRGEFTARGRPTRLRNALVVSQVTVCALLLITGGVLLRGAQHLQSLNVGLRSDGIVQLYPPRALRSRVIERLRLDPGVVTLEAATQAPFDGRFPQIAVTGASNAATTIAGATRVSPGYFGALGIPIVRGRTFSREEAQSGDAVVVVSESAARALWPSGDVLGATVTLAPPYATAAGSPRTARVVGVVGDVVAGFIAEHRDHPTLYEPANVERELATLIVVTRSSSDLAIQSVNRSLASVDPSGSIEVHTLDESVGLQVYPFRAAHWVASALGAIALLLTITGIYGVLAYIVALRQKEIGIRVTLGASRAMIVGLVVRQSVRLAITGVVAGAVISLGVSRMISAQLTMIPPIDVVALVTGAVVVLVAALAAAYVPSRRAAAVDPAEILKN